MTKKKDENKSVESTEKEDSPLIDRKTDEDEEKSAKKKADKGCDSEEVLAVLCHEFGHWSLSHNLINLCISFVRINLTDYLYIDEYLSIE